MTRSLEDTGARKRMWLLWGIGLSCGMLAALIILVRSASWAGPALANGLRRVLGDRPVTRLEEVIAAAEDRWLRWSQHGARPRSLREASPPDPVPPGPAESRAADAPHAVVDAGISDVVADAGRPTILNPPRPHFVPDPVTPPFPEVAADADGNWEPVVDPERPGKEPLLYRTLLHPDPERSYAELFVVVMQLATIDLWVVPGTQEPESDNPEVEKLAGRGLIAAVDEPLLLAAFNGGFMARHGHHGMWVDGVEIVPLQPGLCTIQRDSAGQIGIASWNAVDRARLGAWYRQTPPCMVEQGQLHPGLANPMTRKWGATLDGETVIRRSAIAVNRAGDQLLVAVSNATTAPALALGMQRAGGWTVAQLDVNWSYPHFLMFPRNRAGEREASPLFRGFLFEPDEMLRRPAPRDFFYVVRRSAE